MSDYDDITTRKRDGVPAKAAVLGKLYANVLGVKVKRPDTINMAVMNEIKRLQRLLKRREKSNA